LTLGGKATPYYFAALTDGDRTLVAAGPGHLDLYDAATGRETAKLTPNPDARYYLQPVSDDRLAVLGRTKQSATLWLLEGGKLQRLFEARRSFDFDSFAWAVSLDLRRIAIVVGASETAKPFLVWDVASGKECFPQQRRAFGTMAFSPDGTTL